MLAYVSAIWLTIKILLKIYHVPITMLSTWHVWPLVCNFPLRQPSKGHGAKKSGSRFRNSQAAPVFPIQHAVHWLFLLIVQELLAHSLLSLLCKYLSIIVYNTKSICMYKSMKKYMYIWMFFYLNNEDVNLINYFTVILSNSQRSSISLECLLCCLLLTR